MNTAIKVRQKRVANENPAIFVESRDALARVPQRMALIDSRGNIIAVNKDWMAFAEKAGTPMDRVGPGVNYLKVCRESSKSCADSRKALAGIYSVLRRKASSFTMDYTSHAPLGRAHYRMNVVTIAFSNARVVISHTDITDLHLSKEYDCRRLQQFARRLIGAQEGERQRIGREIHDDIGNRIALMALSVRQFMKQHSHDLGTKVRELDKLVQDITDLTTALRNLSHWLHPPALGYLGVGAALKSLQEVFEKTHGIRVNVVVPGVLPRLPDEVELCIFRVSQECLQNIAKHSGAEKVKIVLEHTNKQIQLTVSDTGRGFDRSKVIHEGGLGLLSMEERALSLRGQLTVSSLPGVGTKVRLTIPMQEDPASVTVQ